MPNINYTLLKDFITFSGIDTKVTYFIQDWDGLGFTTEDVTTGSFYGPIYNPGSTLVYNTFVANFIIDEDWLVYETIQNMVLENTTLDGSTINPKFTDITLHLMSNTYKKEIAQIIMHDGYIQNIQNVQNRYNADDPTMPVKTILASIKYQYHEFIRLENE